MSGKVLCGVFDFQSCHGAFRLWVTCFANVWKEMQNAVQWQAVSLMDFKTDFAVEALIND